MYKAVKVEKLVEQMVLVFVEEVGVGREFNFD